ncbi:hypothetical protein NQ160_03925 [Microbacterium sp. zg.Y909]|nr:hypothetical protein [Microbacterium sp. zg.Y909]
MGAKLRPLAVWTMQPATFPRLAAALFTASTARRAFIQSLIEYPTIRFENTSLMAQR